MIKNDTNDILQNSPILQINTVLLTLYPSNQHNRMISEGSFDTEALLQHCITGINNILKYIKIETGYFKL